METKSIVPTVPGLAESVAAHRTVLAADSKYPIPDTFIPSDRFNALIDRLKQINETDDEARDKAIQFALLDVGQIAPESSRSYYE